MTTQERAKVVSVISRKIRENGSLRLNQLSRVFGEEEIDRALYSGTGPKRWLNENFPEFHIEGSNGMEAIIFADDPLVRIRTILDGILDAKGQILLATIPGLLEPHGIQYKEVSQGQRLTEWLPSVSPQFVLSSDKLWLSRREDAPVPVSEAVLAEVKQMHAAAFMNWWSNNIKKLRSYNEELNSENQVKATVAHQFANAMLGMPGVLIDAREEEEPRIAIDTGLESKTGYKIYCILILNPKNDDGRKQKWALADFACADEDTPYGVWLRDYCTPEKEKYASFATLEEKALEADSQCEGLIPLLEQYLESVSRGVIPEQKIADAVTAFEHTAAELKSIYEEVWDEDFPEEVTIKQIVEQVGGKNAVAQQIKNAIEAFDAVADQVQEMFVRDRLLVLELPTTQRDKNAIHQQYDNLAGEVDFGLFDRTLKAYRALLNVMSAPVMSDEIDAQIETVLCAHFPEILYRFAVRFLMGSEEQEWEYLKQIEQIEEQIGECRYILSSSSDKNKGIQDDQEKMEELFAGDSLQVENDGIVLSEYAQWILPENSVEKMLVFAQKEELKSYLESHRDDPLYSAETMKVLADPEFPTELTYYGAAARLYRVIQNRSQLAEKYYILGLAFDETRCAPALLELYREEKNEEAFQKIFIHFFSEQRVSVEDQIFYLSILCRKSSEAAFEYVRENYYLLYQEESLDLLLSLPEGTFSPETEELLQKRKEALVRLQDCNPLERAIISRDMKKIREFAAAPDVIREMGYSEEEMERILKASGSEMVPGQEDYDTGLHLYRFQKNLHGLAEKYMWKGIAVNKQIRGTQLMLLLAQESRWKEACELYEHFQKLYSEELICRQCYLISLLHSDAVRAQEYIRVNLQDCLQMFESTAMIRTAVQELAESENQEISAFYGQILTLSELLADPFVKSVVFMDRTLREYATAAYTKELGLPEKLVNGISSLYKSDNYPHGMDAISISDRAFRFLGIYKGISEAFAKFALPDLRAVDQLWEIYSELEEEPLQFQLLQEYPQLRSEHKELYLKVLFQREAYEAFVAECAEEEYNFGRMLQLFIAELKLNPDSEITLPSFAEAEEDMDMTAWFRTWGSLLTATLVHTNRISDIETVLFSSFRTWMKEYPAETIRAIVTGDDSMGSDMLSVIQKDALLQNQKEAALYIYHVLHVGELKELSEEFVEQKMAEIDSLDIWEKLTSLQQLQIIYGGTLDKLDARIALMRVQQIKEKEELPSREKAEEISAVIKDYPANEEAVLQLLSLLEDSGICFEYAVYTNLAQLAAKLENQREVLAFFHKLAMEPGAEENREYIGFVCRFYIHAFTEGWFPEEMLQDTLKLCTFYVGRYKAADGILCLYFVEKYLHQDSYALYLLRILADQSTDLIGEELGKIVGIQLQNTWSANLPSYFELFKEFLNESTLEEIREYIKFAHIASSMNSGDAVQAQTSVTEWESRMLSENDSNAVIRQLFANPDDASVWKQCTKLPLQDNPVGYAKILFMASRRNPDLWEECADYCEKYERFDLLLEALRAWASCLLTDTVAECRMYLEEHLMNQPDYFAKWAGKQELLDISKTICNRVKQSEVEYHATLRAASLIAVKTGFPEAIDHLMEKFGHTLLGNCCNLGVVMAAYLLLDRRFEEAKEFLALLKTVLVNMNYREMVEELSEMSAAELEQWMNDAENEIMLHLILPDGNSPRLQEINTITYNGIRNGQTMETAEVLSHISTMFPNDYGVYNALFNLCCTEFEGFLPILHTSLRGLVRLVPNRNAIPYYRRDSKQYARMLATLDALLLANGNSSLVEDYNFAENTGEYFRRVGAASLPYSESMAVSEVRDSILSALKNRSNEEIARLSQAYLSCITGNWMELLKSAWENKTDIQYELSCRIDGVDDLGFARSVLRVLLDVEAEERGHLVLWLKAMLKRPDKTKIQAQRQRQIDFVEAFLNKGYFDQLEKQMEFDSLRMILDSPLEDYSFASFLKKQYVELAIKKNSEHLFALVWLLGALVCHDGFQTELAKYADALFAKGNDRQACSLYHVMYELNRFFNLVHIDFRAGKNNMAERKRVREEYEAKYRITAVFSKDREMMAKVGATDFHVWSCINLVLTLLYSSRADEVLRLTSYLNRENAQLAEAVLRGFNRGVDDREKLDLIDTLHSDVAKAYFCYVLKYPYNPYNRTGAITTCYGLTNTEVADEVNRRYVGLAKMLITKGDSSIYKMSPSHMLLLESKYVNPLAFKQKDPSMWSMLAEAVENEEPAAADETPFFAEGLEPLHDQTDVQELMNEHRKLQNLAIHVQDKMELSEKIYRHCLGGGCSQAEIRDALLLFGSDCYYAALTAEDRDRTNRTVLALAKLLKQSQPSGDGYDTAENTVSTALYELLRSFGTLNSLLASYGEHRSVYFFMRSLLKDPLLLNCVGQIYEVLDNLRDCYSSVAAGNPEMLREELSVNYRQLEKIETNRWMELKNRIQKLINDEINELDQRPVLQVEVLNTGVQRNYGCIFGQVCNIGQATAENIVLQANYDNNSHSRQYVLQRLAPRAKAVFEIDYGTAPGTEAIEYYLNVAFSYDGKTYTSLASKGSMTLGEIREPEYPAKILCKDPNGIHFAVDEESGEVYSPDFVGRKKETAELRALVEGDDFAAYKSALLYGIRRTGKTSLLNYLATYMEAYCPNVICIKTDCQDMPAVNCIQYVFVDRVIDLVERQLPELRGEDSWGILRNNWYSDHFCADLHPEKLSLFYYDVKQLIGDRGLYLIIDEIDRLFERVEEGQSKNNRNLDSLFGALSAMLNSPECKSAVHFVICGSNWLIRYNLKGDKMNQLFQRFGKQVIEIGKLPEEDAKAVICTPYKDYPELVISKDALDWIWNYTGGMVWHTKLLGEESIQRAKDDFRCVVYPSDVQQSLAKVINDHWCKQFYEGCESGAEYQLVDAMQSLAAKRDGYVHIGRISELLNWEVIEVQRTMVILKALKVVAQHPVDQQLYRFEQDIYRRYFRSTPSLFDKIPEEPDIFQSKQQLEEAAYEPKSGNEEEQVSMEEDSDDWDGFN